MASTIMRPSGFYRVAGETHEFTLKRKKGDAKRKLQKVARKKQRKK
jgi:hypothetical protein